MKLTRRKPLSACIECVLKTKLAETRPLGRVQRRMPAPSLTVGFLPPGGDPLANSVDVFRLTRELIDIPSVTGDEFQIGTSLGELLVRLGYHVELQDVSSERSNIIATTEARPRVILSTHMDTVPPFIAYSEDDEFIYGRGACDAKGIIATQIAAGGTRANVIPEAAQATLQLRLAVESTSVKTLVEGAIAGRATIDYRSVHDPVRLMTIEGFASMLARFTTDIPYLSNWGQPLLIG